MYNQNLNNSPMYNLDAETFMSVNEQFPVVNAKVTNLQPQGYVRPRNVCEELVEKELDLLLSRYIDVCRCKQCRADIIALSLKELPARYVTESRNIVPIDKIGNEYLEMVMKSVYKSVKLVQSKPRNTCAKTVTFIWKTAEQLEWVN